MRATLVARCCCLWEYSGGTSEDAGRDGCVPYVPPHTQYALYLLCVVLDTWALHPCVLCGIKRRHTLAHCPRASRTCVRSAWCGPCFAKSRREGCGWIGQDKYCFGLAGNGEMGRCRGLMLCCPLRFSFLSASEYCECEVASPLVLCSMCESWKALHFSFPVHVLLLCRCVKGKQRQQS